ATATQPGTDTSGTWSDVDAPNGVYRYDFGVVVPDTYPTDKSHRIALYATRTFDSVDYVSNDVFDFRPDAMPITDTRDVVTTAACNTCHSQLEAHGGSRRDTRLCVTCHARGYDDPDTG